MSGANPAMVERNEQIVQLRRDGLSYPKIAVQFGISEARARQVAQKVLGVPVKDPTRYPTLTKRQENVLWCVSEGLTFEQGAARIGISRPTYLFHVKALRRKFGVGSARELHPCAWRYFK